MLNFVALVYCSDISSLYDKSYSALFFLSISPKTRDYYHSSTGFFINSNAVGVSVAHYVDRKHEQNTYEVHYKGKSYEAKVLNHDKNSGLLIVKAAGLENTEYLTLANSTHLGEELALFGVDQNSNIFIETGYLLEEDFEYKSRIMLRSSVWAGPGYIGGPVLNQNGEVLGVHSSFSGLYMNVNDSLAIPSQTIQNFLNKLSP